MTVTDLVVVRSEEHTVDSPQFESFVRELVGESETAALGQARTYFDEARRLARLGGPARDHHADRRSPTTARSRTVVAEVEGADEDAAFAVSMTGDETLDHDFNLLSQEDLENGELQFGLPAALIILLLVFGAVVAGLVPLLMAIVSIVVALGLTALVAQPFELSVFVINMLTGMGLALGIDYSLFVVSRYREERARGRSSSTRSTASGRPRAARCSSAGRSSSSRCSGCCIVPSSIMRSLAVGAILVGIVSVVAALTLLPAVLGLLGDKRQRAAHPVHRAAHPRVGELRGALLGRDRAPRAAAAGAQPRALGRRAPPRRAADPRDQHRHGRRVRRSPTASSPSRASSRSSATSRGRRRIRPRSSSPRARRSEDVTGALEELRATLAADARFGSGEIRRSADGEVAVLSVPVAGDPADPETIDGRARAPQRARCRRRSRGRTRRCSSAARRRRTSTTSTR